jgi:hypothetical protein
VLFAGALQHFKPWCAVLRCASSVEKREATFLRRPSHFGLSAAARNGAGRDRVM